MNYGNPREASIIDIVLEFLEAAVHQILFVRRLYAEELFERRRLYGIAVRKSRHPDLNAYIGEVFASLRKALVGGTLSKVAVLVRTESGQPVERFIFEPRLLAPPPDGERLDLQAIEWQLKGALLKLQYSDTYLSRLPPDSTFEINAYTIDRDHVDPRLWVEEQEQLEEQERQGRAWTGTAAGAVHDGATQATPESFYPGQRTPGLEPARWSLGSGRILPIKSCSMEGAFHLQLYAEVA